LLQCGRRKAKSPLRSKRASDYCLVFLAPRPGLEPGTCGLTDRNSRRFTGRKLKNCTDFETSVRNRPEIDPIPKPILSPTSNRRRKTDPGERLAALIAERGPGHSRRSATLSPTRFQSRQCQTNILVASRKSLGQAVSE
jgi:hypothetical protein